LYPQATPEQIAGYLAKHVADQRRQDEQEAMAQVQAAAAQAAAAQQATYAQNAMMPGQQSQYMGYSTATQYPGGYQQGYVTDQSQQFAVVDPSLLQNQQVPGSYYPQQSFSWGQ